LHLKTDRPDAREQSAVVSRHAFKNVTTFMSLKRAHGTIDYASAKSGMQPNKLHIYTDY